MLPGPGRVAGAVLRHQKDVLPPRAGFERPAHQLLAAAHVVVPSVVEEGEPFIGRPLDETDCRVVGDFRLREVPTAEAEVGDRRARAPEDACGQSHG